MMNKGTNKVVVLVVMGAATVVVACALLHFTAAKRRSQSGSYLSNPGSTRSTNGDLWIQGAEKVKADRGEPAGGRAAVEVPAALRHYDDTHWFLATQIAEIRKYNIQTCKDFVDLAAMIQHGEMVAVPAVTDDYILFGVGENADDHRFSRYFDDQSIELYNEAGLRDAYGRLDAARANFQTEIAGLKAQLSSPKNRGRTKQGRLQKEITTRQQELRSTEESKALLDRFYGQPDSRQRLFRDYESLRALAENFGGRAYNIDDPSDRQMMKVNMLRSLRAEALRVLEEVATEYRRKFDRPLPVSSLIRPEEYQHALKKVNRNAVLIDTPPHSTGLAFDIDYCYMSAEEQSFLMTRLARLKDEGRIEVLRERNANYHLFAFIDGKRPSDELITASLDEAGAPVREANHATKKPAKAKGKSQNAKTKGLGRVRKRR